MNKKVFFLLLILLALIGWIYGFQGQKIPPEKHEVEVKLILVDVIVTKDGKFVKDLTKEDFELYEDGKRVTINSFELISFEERELKILEEKKEVKLPEPPKRKLTVVFDGINSWKKELREQSKDIIDELESLIKLGNEVMICQMSRSKGLEILQPFTTDDELIRSSIEKASANVWNLGSDIGLIPPFDDLSQGDPWYYKNMMRMDYLLKERKKFEKSIGGILGTVNLIKGLPGRKTILLISGGIPDLSPPDILPNMGGHIDPKSRYFFGKLSTAAAAKRTQIFNIDKDIKIFDHFNILGKKAFRNGEEVLREIMQFANAQNISIYTLDSDIFVKHLFSGASAELYQQYELGHYESLSKDRINRTQNLRWISEDTGADYMRGADKFDQFRKVMSTDLTYYYQLSFYPKREEADNESHTIKINVKRRGINVRHRKAYTDYTKEKTNDMQLITALYNPSLFKELPFRAEFIPFITKSGKYEPWMNIALPARDLFIERFVEFTTKIFNFHIWISDNRSGEKSFGGQIKLPFNINSSFMEFIRNVDFLNFHFKGPGLPFKQAEYKAIFALVDPQTNEIGTWESSLSLPNFKKSKEAVIINCVLGDVATNPNQGIKFFSLSKKDGGLEYGQIKFYPKVTSQFFKHDNASVFLQIYLPQGKEKIRPEFLAKGEDKILRPVSGEGVAESWYEKTKIWTGIYKFDLSSAAIGNNYLYVEIQLSEEDAVLSRELKMTIVY